MLVHTLQISSADTDCSGGISNQPCKSFGGYTRDCKSGHTGCLRVQRESSDSQVHDLGAGLQGYGNQCPGLLLGSGNKVIPLVPLIFSSTGGSSRAADQGDSDLYGVGGSNVVASVGLTKDRNGSNLSVSGI